MMRRRKKEDGFLYWKYSWQKWVALAGVAAALVNLVFGIQEYRKYQLIAPEIFSSAGWASYAAARRLVCLSYGVTAAIFSGMFLIGLLAVSQRESRRAEFALFLILSLVWSAGGIALGLILPDSTGVLWGAVLAMLLGGAAWSLWKRRPE